MRMWCARCSTVGLAAAVAMTGCVPPDADLFDPNPVECRDVAGGRVLSVDLSTPPPLAVGEPVAFGVTLRRPADPNGGGGTVYFDWYRSNSANPLTTGTVVYSETKVRADSIVRGTGGFACSLEYSSSLAIPSVVAADNGAVFQVRVRDSLDPHFSAPGAVVILGSTQVTLSVDALAPAHLTATPGLNSITLSWGLNPTAISYILERSTGGAALTPLASFAGPANSYVDQVLTPATLYAYQLRAVSLAGTSIPVRISATTLDPAAPPPPPPPPPPFQGWVTLGGGPISQGELQPAPAVVVDPQGRPVVAYIEAIAGDVGRLWVKRFEGNAWIALGGGSVTEGSTTAASDPTLLIDGDGELLVGWSQGDGIQQNVYVAVWGTPRWYLQGGSVGQLNLRPGSRAVRPSLAIQPDGRVAAAWVEDGSVAVKLYRGGFGFTSWTTPHSGAAGPATRGVEAVKLAVDAAGDPVTAYTVGTGSARTLQASVAKSAGWQPFGGAVNFPVSGNFVVRDPFDLVLDGNGAPYVAFAQGTSPFAVYLRYWDGAAWTLLGNAVWNSNTTALQSVAMTRRPGGALTIALSETGGGVGTLQIREFSGLDWQVLAALGTAAGSEALALAVTGLRSPVVAEVQPAGNGLHVLTVRRYYP